MTAPCTYPGCDHPRRHGPEGFGHYYRPPSALAVLPDWAQKEAKGLWEHRFLHKDEASACAELATALQAAHQRGVKGCADVMEIEQPTREQDPTWLEVFKEHVS